MTESYGLFLYAAAKYMKQDAHVKHFIDSYACFLFGDVWQLKFWSILIHNHCMLIADSMQGVFSSFYFKTKFLHCF